MARDTSTVQTSFEERIKNAKLTKSGREIARFLLDNLLRVSYMTATSIAQELNISDVTVIRFARSLGYSGYSDLQKDLQRKMSDNLETSSTLLANPSSVLRMNMEVSADSSTIMDLACNNEIKNLNRFISRNNDATFVEASYIIMNSHRKIVFGVRGSSSMAFSFTMRLRYMMDDVFPILYADPNDSYPLYSITKDDCLVIFGFVNLPQATIDAVELAKKRGAKIIAFTDMEASFLAKSANVAVICSVAGISFSSYTTPLLATEIISANIAHVMGEETERRNQDLADNMNKRKYFSSK